MYFNRNNDLKTPKLFFFIYILAIMVLFILNITKYKTKFD